MGMVILLIAFLFLGAFLSGLVLGDRHATDAIEAARVRDDDNS